MNFFKNLFLLFQTLHYHAGDFLKKIYSLSGWKLLHTTPRQQLDYTLKMKGIITLSLVIFVIVSTLGFSYLALGNAVILLFLLLIFFPCLVVLASYILQPLQYYLTRKTLKQASQLRTTRKDLIVIGIVGSYGKTSMKELLIALLKDHYNILAPSGNINTPLGLAKLLLETLHDDHQVLIMELGESHPGDINELCSIVQPTHAIITGATLQHAETLGSYTKVLDTLCEILSWIEKSGWKVIYNADIEDIQTKIQPSKNHLAIHLPQPIHYKPDFWWISFVYKGEQYETKLLANHNARTIAIGLEMRKIMGIETSAKDIITWLPFVTHRMEVIYNPKSQVTIIDDSYNGNIEGVRSICDLMDHQNVSGRKIYLTPGLVELGSYNHKIHVSLGMMIGRSFDMILLIQSQGSDSILDWLDRIGFSNKKIIQYPNTKQAHAALGSFLQAGDVIVFQNDVPDMMI
jgi:UDP-N-acetylmuramoyl-tripeptide--D-alanyl-D-alanine ligase